ncbi:hypothetical protein VPH35_082223 [Triticum aestivum]
MHQAAGSPLSESYHIEAAQLREKFQAMDAGWCRYRSNRPTMEQLSAFLRAAPGSITPPASSPLPPSLASRSLPDPPLNASPLPLRRLRLHDLHHDGRHKPKGARRGHGDAAPLPTVVAAFHHLRQQANGTAREAACRGGSSSCSTG